MKAVLSRTQTTCRHSLFGDIQDKRNFATVVGLHLCVAILYKTVVGIDIQADPSRNTWDWFWQTLPAESLLWPHIAESVWNLHAQPPLYNLYGAFFINLFRPEHLRFMQFANILMGSLLSGMLYVILREFTHHRKFSFILAALLALNPALFLYEAYILYELLVAFLLVLSVFCLSLYGRSRNLVFVGLFLLSITLVVLTRSLYHVIFLALTVVVACVSAPIKWKQVLVAGVCLSLLPLGWYGKNLVNFGFFGSSTWMGQGLWRVAQHGYDSQQLADLADRDVIDKLVAVVPAFSLPSVYTDWGFSRTSNVGALSRNDYNNVNIPSISAVYQTSAIRLILHDPLHVLRNIPDAYIQFCAPSSRFKHLSINASRIRTHERVGSQILYGQYAFAMLGLPRVTFLFFLLPLSLALYVGSLLRCCGISRRAWVDKLRTDTPMFFTAYAISYTVVTACCFEYGENDRFKFCIEQLLWAFVATVSFRLYRQQRQRICKAP